MPVYRHCGHMIFRFSTFSGQQYFEMMNMPVVTSQYWNIVYGREEGQAALDTEGMQTMRTMANNMAWLLKKIHANGSPDYPIREEWQPMNFIR